MQRKQDANHYNFVETVKKGLKIGDKILHPEKEEYKKYIPLNMKKSADYLSTDKFYALIKDYLYRDDNYNKYCLFVRNLIDSNGEYVDRILSISNFEKAQKEEYIKRIIQDYQEAHVSDVDATINFIFELAEALDQKILKKEKALISSSIKGNHKADETIALALKEARASILDKKKVQGAALKNLTKAANSGNSEALYLLGCVYFDDLLTDSKTDYYKAFDLFMRSASRGYPDSYYRLGYCYEYAKGTDCDIDEAIKNYKIAIKYGSKEAEKRYALLKLKQIASSPSSDCAKEDVVKWIAIASKEVENNSMEGCLALAKLYEDGKYVNKDMAEAAKYYEAYSKFVFNKDIVLKLIDFYFCEDERSVNNAKTRKYILSLIQNLKEPSVINIISAYYNKNPRIAYLLCEESLNKYPENAYALELASIMLFKGKGTEKDLNKAFEYIYKSAKLGNLNALFAVANCYAYGSGVERNDDSAFYFYYLSALRGEKRAYEVVSKCFREGLGVTRDLEQAEKWKNMG